MTATDTTRTRRLNITVPVETATELETRVARRGRSAFVAAAIRDRLEQLEREELTRLLEEGYRATAKGDAELNAEWEPTVADGLN